jgi:hypothetical protein
MPLSFEISLVRRIVHDEDLRTVRMNGITASLFQDADARFMFKYITDYYMNAEHRGRIPTARIMEDMFPTIFPINVVPKETLPELCKFVRGAAIARKIQTECMEIVDISERDPYEAVDALRALYTTVGTMTLAAKDLILSEAATDLIDEYEQGEALGAITGIRWPWFELDQETQGIQPEDFIVFYARPKSLKSWIAVKTGAHAYAAGNCRVLYYSCEMPKIQILRRAALCLSALNYRAYKRYNLEENDKLIFRQTLESLKESDKSSYHNGSLRHACFRVAVHTDDPNGGGVAHVHSKIEEFSPDLVIVDGFYRMKNDRTGKVSVKWEDQYAIPQDLKNLTQIMHVPIIGITQRTRPPKGKKGEKVEDDSTEETTEDIAFGDAVGQEADLLVRIKKKRTEHEELGVPLDLMFSGARETTSTGISLLIKLCESWEVTHKIAETGKRIPSKSEIVRQAKKDYYKKADENLKKKLEHDRVLASMESAPTTTPLSQRSKGRK